MFRTIVFLFALVVFSLFLFGSVAAQDVLVTNTPAPDVVITETPVLENPPAPSSPINEVSLTWGQLLLLLGLTAVVMIPSGAGIAAIFFQYLSRKDVRDTAEKLFQGAAPDTQELIREQLEYAQETISKLLEFATAVTDGKPNIELPATD